MTGPSAAEATMPADHGALPGPVAPRLVAEQLGFAYPGRPLLTGWSHTFGPGLTWVRGANGCGKSTLLRLLGGALVPQAGRLLACGMDAARQPEHYRRAVYWCGPGPIAFDHLRPAEYFAFLAGLYPTMDLGALHPLVEALGLAPFMPKRMDQLSTGTGRKVAVAAALVVGAPVVLIDEPLAAVDLRSQRHLQQQLARLAARPDRVLVVTSHEGLGEAEALAQVLDLDAPAA
jgi:ABC-type multidrug transport system ATPase subunit